MAADVEHRRPRPSDRAGLARASGPAPAASSAALLHVRIPVERRARMYFGGIALFLFGIQAVTGTLLALYYKPTPDAAYDSVSIDHQRRRASAGSSGASTTGPRT